MNGAWRKRGGILATGLACAGFVLLNANAAWAFSAVESFGYKAARAGGGGRYFTGSPADGYTCRVCHSGGAEPTLGVLGLPLAGYVPNTRYEIIVDWSHTAGNLAAVVEITDTKGRRAGSIHLPPVSETDDPEFCPAVNEGDPSPASSVVGVPPEGRATEYCGDATAAPPAECRQVVSVTACGAARLRFLWNAPGADVGPVWIAGSTVLSDGQSDVGGDGVSDFSRVIGSPSVPAVLASKTRSGCSALATPAACQWWPGIVAIALARRWWRRTRRAC
jgi:hypothetical protein